MTGETSGLGAVMLETAAAASSDGLCTFAADGRYYA